MFTVFSECTAVTSVCCVFGEREGEFAHLIARLFSAVGLVSSRE